MVTVGILIVLFFILGMFLSLVGNRPRTDAEWHSDTETGDEVHMTRV
jgi:preprotein translocase subunit SecG